MSNSDVLHGNGHQVVKVSTTDTVAAAVSMVAEHRIGAVIVEDQKIRFPGIFSEGDFINAVAKHGAQALSFQSRSS